MINSWEFTISQRGGDFIVSGIDIDSDSSLPHSHYPTKEQAAARLLQLMGIKSAVVPQDWPEEVCIGES